jgi:hypothetical protein
MEPMAADDVPRCPERRRGPLRVPVRGRAGRPVRKVVIGAGLAAYSWVAASTVPFTRNALLVVLRLAVARLALLLPVAAGTGDVR